jgi:hypothetical protein
LRNGTTSPFQFPTYEFLKGLFLDATTPLTSSLISNNPSSIKNVEFHQIKECIIHLTRDFSLSDFLPVFKHMSTFLFKRMYRLS